MEEIRLAQARGDRGFRGCLRALARDEFRVYVGFRVRVEGLGIRV